MKAGIKVSNTFRVALGDAREEVIENLNASNLKYIISFDKLNSARIKETIIQLPALNMEISLSNDIVVYMQSKINEYNVLFDAYNMKSIDIIKKLKDVIVTEFSFTRKTEFKIEGINLKTLDTNIIITERGETVRVHIQKDNKSQLYISAVKYE